MPSKQRPLRTLFLAVGLCLTSPVSAAPPEFEVEVYSDKVQNPTAICFDDQGRLYVTETFRWGNGVEDNRNHTYWIMDDLASETNEQRVAYYYRYASEKLGDPDYFTKESERVVVLSDADGDGKAGAPSVFADGFNAAEDGPAIGLLADDQGKIFLANIPHVWLLEDKDGDLKADTREKIVSGFGVKTSLSGHDLHGLAWGPHDGKLYFSMGDRGYNITSKEGRVFKNTNSGGAFRCNPDGSNLELVYHNLRNPQEIAFNEFGDLFTVDNNCDQGDSARVCYLIEGGDAGWTLGTQALTTYSDFIQDGGMEQRPNWLVEGHWKTRFKGQPAWIMPPIAHLTNGPSGMVFNSGTSMPGRYQNNFFVCDYKGAPNVCFLYSFRVKQEGAGYVMEDAHVFHNGVPNTDVEIGYDGKIYVADFGGGWKRTDKGNIYTLFDPKGIEREAVNETSELFSKGFPEDSEALLALLSHEDMRVRMRAQFNLAKQGKLQADRLLDIARSGNLHAVWALRQIGAGEHLMNALEQGGDELRAQIFRALGDINYAPATELLRISIHDKSPRARCFATIAAAKLGDRMAIPSVIELLRKNDNRDLNERHAAIYALEHLMTDQDSTNYINDKSSAVRLGVLLAMRRQLNPRVADFLDDTDPALVTEAISAINDLDIQAAVPALADFSKRLSGKGHGKAPKLSEPVFRRIINANVRAGKPENAANLVALAANPQLANKWRSLCLLALETFAAPQPIDPTMGIYRPLEKRAPTEIRAAIELPILALFQNATGEIAAGTTRVITTYEIVLDPQLLTHRILDSRQPEPMRIAALQQLASNREFTDKSVFRDALADSAGALRACAAKLWSERFPADRLEVIDALLLQTGDSDLRTAYSLLSIDKSAGSSERLAGQLEALKNGTLFRTVHLDLYEAIEAQADAALIEKLDGIDPFQLTREGGDPLQGRKVFENQGICLKCHTALRGDGDAGPPLGTIARLRRDDELLDSLLNPSATIVPGYGIATITLKDDTAIVGSSIEETDTQLILKDASGAMKEIPLTNIKSRSAEISAMPPMFTTGILSKQDLRDVMAFLKSLQ
ncbi:MAG: quinoprotein glucose dehydrogenase [Verrucomicrobiales bacterium]|jgi:quinoprotein glucose dehydrogenase